MVAIAEVDFDGGGGEGPDDMVCLPPPSACSALFESNHLASAVLLGMAILLPAQVLPGRGSKQSGEYRDHLFFACIGTGPLRPANCIHEPSSAKHQGYQQVRGLGREPFQRLFHQRRALVFDLPLLVFSFF